MRASREDSRNFLELDVLVPVLVSGEPQPSERDEGAQEEQRREVELGMTPTRQRWSSSRLFQTRGELTRRVRDQPRTLMKTLGIVRVQKASKTRNSWRR